MVGLQRRRGAARSYFFASFWAHRTNEARSANSTAFSCWVSQEDEVKGRIINAAHFSRVESLLEGHGGEVGPTNERKRKHPYNIITRKFWHHRVVLLPVTVYQRPPHGNLLRGYISYLFGGTSKVQCGSVEPGITISSPVYARNSPSNSLPSLLHVTFEIAMLRVLMLVLSSVETLLVFL